MSLRDGFRPLPRITNNRELLLPGSLEEGGGFFVVGVEGGGAFEEGGGGGGVFVLVEPEFGEFAEGAGCLFWLFGRGVADGFAEAGLGGGEVAGVAEGAGKFELEVGTEELLVVGVFGVLGESFGEAELERGDFGIAVAEGGDGEAGGNTDMLGVVEAGVVEDEAGGGVARF